MNPAHQILIRLGLLAALVSSSSLLLAQPTGAPGGQGGPRKAPQEALDACKSLNPDSVFSITAPTVSMSRP